MSIKVQSKSLNVHHYTCLPIPYSFDLFCSTLLHDNHSFLKPLLNCKFDRFQLLSIAVRSVPKHKQQDVVKFEPTSVQ